MKNTFTALIAASAVLFIGSCSRFEGDNVGISKGRLLQASFEKICPITKTGLDSDRKLFWSADDRLSVFDGNTYNQEYRYIGETGKTSADFEIVPQGLHSGNDISTTYAVYPYSQDNEISNSEVLTTYLPSIQQYAAGSFGLGANTMVAVTNGTSDTYLAFKNLSGYLVIKLYGEGMVKSISLKGNNGEKIAGTATVNASYSSEPTLSMASSATEEITLDCGSGVALGTTSQTATEFWFCIPPTTFTKGFSIKITNTAGGLMEKSLSSSRTISRNTINSMSALEVEFSEPPIPVPEIVDLGLSVKWATCNLGASKPEDFGDYYAWGETETYYEEGYAQNNLQNHWKSKYETYGYDWPSYKWSNGNYYSLTKYNTEITAFSFGYNGFYDDKYILDPEDDAAHVLLGGDWRIPTKEEWWEMIDNCDTLLNSQNGIVGVTFVSRKNGNSIFIPSTGAIDGKELWDIGEYISYWSSSLYTNTNDPEGAYLFWCDESQIGLGFVQRVGGFPIRPINGPFISVSGISLSKTQLDLNCWERTSIVETISPSNATHKNVIWTSEDSNIATVDNAGNIFAVNPGQTMIFATTEDGGFSSTCVVNVSKPVVEEVDLGLSVKWGNCNIGASTPEEYGDYYAWGETDTHYVGGQAQVEYPEWKTGYSDGYSWYCYKWVNGYERSISKYNSHPMYGSVDNITVIVPEDDVVHVKLGGKWRMPTIEEWNELCDTTNCSWSWETYKGVQGMRIMSKKEGYVGNWIFLPPAGAREDRRINKAGKFGYYSSSSLSNYCSSCRCLAFGAETVSTGSDGAERCNGLSVRPVSE